MVTKNQLHRLERAMLPIEEVPPEPNHYFAKGMYLRELSLPAGMLIVGKMHKREHFFVMTRGRARIVSEFGEIEAEAGYILVSPPGSKRAILAMEDCTFLTVHANEEDTQDLTLLEDQHIENEFLELERQKIRGQLNDLD